MWLHPLACVIRSQENPNTGGLTEHQRRRDAGEEAQAPPRVLGSPTSRGHPRSAGQAADVSCGTLAEATGCKRGELGGTLGKRARRCERRVDARVERDATALPWGCTESPGNKPDGRLVRGINHHAHVHRDGKSLGLATTRDHGLALKWRRVT